MKIADVHSGEFTTFILICVLPLLNGIFGDVKGTLTSGEGWGTLTLGDEGGTAVSWVGRKTRVLRKGGTVSPPGGWDTDAVARRVDRIQALMDNRTGRG